MSAAGEWLEWHREYDDPQSPQARRLATVQRLVAAALDRAPAGEIRVISMCAGDGRDLLGALRAHSRRNDVRARLVEIDPTLVTRGRDAARHEALEHVSFFIGDASKTSAYAGAVPADVVLVCGVFGNVSDDDVHNTVVHLPELCATGATVIWTRGRFHPDLTPAIRCWFIRAGFEELEFVPIEESTGAVGANRFALGALPFVAGQRIFTFLARAERPSSRRCDRT